MGIYIDRKNIFVLPIYQMWHWVFERLAWRMILWLYENKGSHHSAPPAYESIPGKTKCLDVLSEGSPLEYYMGRYLTRTPGSINNNLLQSFAVKTS